MDSESADDSLCILYEKITPKPEVEIVNEIGGRSSEETEPQLLQSFIDIYSDFSPPRAEGSSQDSQLDDSVCILQENKKSKPEMLSVKKKSSKKDENEPETSRNKKTKIECGICFDSLNEILESNRTLVSTVCGHIFCNSCMAASRLNSTQCPNCRKRLGKTQFHPIYF